MMGRIFLEILLEVVKDWRLWDAATMSFKCPQQCRGQQCRADGTNALCSAHPDQEVQCDFEFHCLQ
jgi:hypothetical protein